MIVATNITPVVQIVAFRRFMAFWSIAPEYRLNECSVPGSLCLCGVLFLFALFFEDGGGAIEVFPVTFFGGGFRFNTALFVEHIVLH